MTRALVLGGGGPVGIAWELGVVAGLAEAGVNLAKADRVVGTSAGSVVGAQIGSGRALGLLYADHLALADHEAADMRARSALPDLGPLMAFLMRRPPVGPAPQGLLAEIGAYALRDGPDDESAFLAGIGRLVGVAQPWPAAFVCTAVEAATGAFQLWDAASGIDLVQAVASSCAVPGLYPAITIEGRRFVDGGIRSSTNGDLAEGFDDVLLLAVTVPAYADFMAAAAARELADLKPRSRTTLIVPDAGALSAFGPNLMDPTRRVTVAQEGYRQGLAEANRLRTTWV